MPYPMHAQDLSRRTLLLGSLTWPLLAHAQPPAPPLPPEVGASLPGARLQGSGRLNYLGLHVYDARLWVDDGFQADSFASVPLAIEIEYARMLSGKLIAKGSIGEMKKLGAVPATKAEGWLAEMTRIFPDVNKGDRITGVQLPGETARFYINGRPRGEIRDVAFVPLFFGIWLSPRSSEPKLRQALVGGGRLGG